MTRSSSKRIQTKVKKKTQPKRSTLLPGIMTKADHEQLLRVYSFFFAISDALEGNPVLLGTAKGVAKGVVDELAVRYENLYGTEAVEALFKQIEAELSPPTPEESEDASPKESAAT